MPRTFVGDGKSPTARARRFSRGILSVSDGPGPRDHNDARTTAKSSLQGNRMVTDDFRFTGNDFRQYPSHGVGSLRTHYARHSRACGNNIAWLHIRDHARLPDGRGKGLFCMRFTGTDEIAPSRRPTAEHGVFVANQARSFTATAVNAEKNCHRLVLLQIVEDTATTS